MKHIIFNKKILLITSLFLCTCSNNRLNDSSLFLDENKQIRFPIYSNAKNIKQLSNHNSFVQVITYDVICQYPGSDVSQFYQKKLSGLGFSIFSEPYYENSQGKWQTYFDSTKQNNTKNIAQMKIDWIDLNKTKRATLLMQYYYTDSDLSSVILTNNDKLKVTFQVSPFYILPKPE